VEGRELVEDDPDAASVVAGKGQERVDGNLELVDEI